MPFSICDHGFRRLRNETKSPEITFDQSSTSKLFLLTGMLYSNISLETSMFIFVPMLGSRYNSATFKNGEKCVVMRMSIVFNELVARNTLDCAQSPIFPCDRRCRCGSLNASETGESTKCPWVGVVEGTAGGKNIFIYFFRPLTPRY